LWQLNVNVLSWNYQQERSSSFVCRPNPNLVNNYYFKLFRAGGVAQVVKCLPSKNEAKFKPQYCHLLPPQKNFSYIPLLWQYWRLYLVSSYFPWKYSTTWDMPPVLLLLVVFQIDLVLLPRLTSDHNPPTSIFPEVTGMHHHIHLVYEIETR
jgi:hypothetical protein